MAHLALPIGILVVLFTLTDTFFTVLNYNQRGLMVNRVMRLEWKIIHWAVRPLGFRIRRMIYRTMTGLILLSGIIIWVGGIVLGFALVYLGEIHLGHLKVDTGAPGGFVGALYFSLGQFATVGVQGLTPNSGFVSVLSVAETLISVILLSLVITFLANVFGSIQALRTLCACFPSRTSAVSSPLDPLAPYLPREGLSALENHLADTRESMNAYFDSIAADHSAVFFYSGKERFVMPFAVFMLAGTVEGLGPGLPGNHPASKLPELVRLTEAFEGCQDQIYNLFRWPQPKPVAPLPVGAFVQAAETSAKLPKVPGGGAGTSESERPLPVRIVENFDIKKEIEEDHTQAVQAAEEYVRRFVTLRQVMADMSQISAPTNWADEYKPYTQWLEFATAADDFIRRTSRLFDYHPRYQPGQHQADVPFELYGWRQPQN